MAKRPGTQPHRTQASRGKPSTDDLFAEMMSLVKSAAPVLAKVTRGAKAKRGGPAQLARLKAALASDDPLPQILSLIPDDGQPERTVVIYAHGCMLETGSSGLSMVFDRYEDHELERMIDAVTQIRASRTKRDLQLLYQVFKRAIAGGADRIEAAEKVAQYAKRRKIDAASDAHVQELGDRLLRFCRTHVAELAWRGVRP